ncbi:MAG: cyclase family protein [Syntrophales bacterium]|jgi:kynurenine formamidase|nr:cyclase family protein [Syntrophales bacterium]MDY0043407.1 cyclase family protein [Syntrophales bacterium]
MRAIDLSATIRPSPEGTPDFLKTEIAYHSHAEGAADIKALFGVSQELLRNREGWAVDTITYLGTHSSTHVDAPWHYNSLIQGKRAFTIDELPLEWFFGDGIKLDMTAKAEGDPVTTADIKNELARVSYTLKPLDIVLVNTGRDIYYGEPDYIFKGCGVTAEATHWLYDQGIRVMGIDAWGWDLPLDKEAEKALQKGEKGVFWAAHQADLSYSHMERLINLGELPSFGFKVACFPLKIENASAAPARIVAILPE